MRPKIRELNHGFFICSKDKIMLDFQKILLMWFYIIYLILFYRMFIFATNGKAFQDVRMYEEADFQYKMAGLTLATIFVLFKTENIWVLLGLEIYISILLKELDELRYLFTYPKGMKPYILCTIFWPIEILLDKKSPLKASESE